jgi:hypothetical protein
VKRLLDALASVGNRVHDYATRPDRLDDPYARAEHTRTIPKAELRAAEAILKSGGPVAHRMLRQLRNAPDVWRLRAPDGRFELRISTSLSLGIVPPDRIESDRVVLADSVTGRELELAVAVDRAAIAGMIGRTLDGNQWPRDWVAGEEDLTRICASAPHIRLPTAEALQRQRAEVATALAAWADDPSIAERARRIRPSDPAKPEDVDALELQERVRLPQDYRSLLLITDGLEIGPLTILGSADAYRLDTEAVNRLLIVPADDRGAIVLDENGRVVHVALDDPLDGGREIAPSMRAFVRRRLGAKG